MKTKVNSIEKVSAASVILFLAIWLLGALMVGASGRLTALRPPVPQLVIVLLTLSLLAVTWLVPRVRSWAEEVPIRPLVAVHLTRFVGVYFLILAPQGMLAPGFAIPAGWGDILVATLAVFLL